MPFRSFQLSVVKGTPQEVLVADHDDVEIQIRSTPSGGSELTTGYDFSVGGPDIGTTGGLDCFNGNFRSKLRADDEIWVANIDSAFGTGDATSITVLVRSR